MEKKVCVGMARDEGDGSFAPKDIAGALRRVMVEDEGEVFGDKVKELAKVFGNDEVNDRCVQDFLMSMSEYSRQQQG